MIYIISSLLFISAIAKAVQDKLQFHYKDSVFRSAKHESWWNAKVSWRNKYDWFPKSKVLTWLFSNWLVMFTDAWHFFGFIRDFSIYMALVVAFGNYWLLLGYPVYRLIFHIFFTHIFSKR